jgi:biopolymer transport protein ExbB/TolQ
MGPALVGLAAGDIASMAQNMQVAFSTTVLGIFVGAVGLVAQLLMKRWYQSDSELLRYLLEAKNSETNKVAEAHQDNNHEEAA